MATFPNPRKENDMEGTKIKATRKLVNTLKDEMIGVDALTLHGDGTLTFRQEFFYTHGKTQDWYEKVVTTQLEKLGYRFEVLSKGEVWKPFNGRASVEASSHWYVKVQLVQPVVQLELPMAAVESPMVQAISA